MPVQEQNGFLDGYIAGNISSNASELKTHAEKINDLLLGVKSNIENIELDATQRDHLIKAIDLLEKTHFKTDAGTDDYFKYGVDLSEFMTRLKKTVPQNNLTTESNYLLKRSIYHFLNLAKTLNDPRVIDQATKVAIAYK